jgi:DNA-binding MurR/RpiR family transcriptional regulator
LFPAGLSCYDVFHKHSLLEKSGKNMTLDDQLRAALPSLTRAERQLATHVLSHYPVAALGSITVLAKAALVSTPTVVRLAQKLGYKGYPDFQSALRGEVEAMLVTPLTKHQTRANQVPQGHILTRFAEAVVANLQATLHQIDPAEFDAAAVLLADPGRRVFALGGRITHAVADYFTSLMRAIRPEVTLLSDNSATWPPALLDMARGDVLLVFDIRRYENAVLQVAEMAREQGAEIILITDRWMSPAALHARHTFCAHVEAPSAWDSTAVLMVLVETLLASVQNATWDVTEPRLGRLEELYARTRFFRRHR